MTTEQMLLGAITAIWGLTVFLGRELLKELRRQNDELRQENEQLRSEAREALKAKDKELAEWRLAAFRTSRHVDPPPFPQG